VTVDTTAPIITPPATPPIPDASGALAIDVGDATSATYSINGATPVTVTPDSAGIITIPGFGSDGTYTVVVTASDDAGNTATLPAFSVTVGASDSIGPIIANFIVIPNPAPINTQIFINATISDSTTGNSQIASAEYDVDYQGYNAMSAVDGSFDSPSEHVTIRLDGFNTAGVYSVTIQATDDDGNQAESNENVLIAIYDPSGGFITGWKSS
jgi:hypothetical protein